MALCGDLKQAFLQVRIRSENLDSLRFHWIKDKESTELQVLKFTHALFGLVQSPFLLGGTIQQHLESLREKYPKVVAEVEKSLYVDDVITGGNSREEVLELKNTAVQIFGEAKFDLHKWHSNVSELEERDESSDNGQSYAKQQLEVKPGETKMLGLT